MFPWKRFPLFALASVLVICIGISGNMILSVSGQFTANTFYKFVGCYHDQGQSGGPRSYPYSLSFQGQADINHHHSIAECSFWAASQGFLYFALQNGGDCYGGNADPATMASSNNCNVANVATNNAPCGDSYVNSVYQMSPLNDGSFAFVGCYNDNQTPPRVYPNSPDGGSTYYHGFADCANWALTNNYPYFALQNGGQCFGGTASPTGPTVACTKDCITQGYYGGAWANAVYKIYSSPPVQTEVDYRYIGCFADAAGAGTGQARSLPFSPDFYGSYTYSLNECAQWAQGQNLAYFALQDGGQCAGGNQDPNTFASSTNCNVPCNNIVNGTCGDGYVNSVYKIAGSVRGLSPAVYAYTSIGCYNDNRSGTRVYPNSPDSGRGLSHGLTECANWAAVNSYLYFALQYGGECFAGNQNPANLPGGQVPCGSACNAQSFCGGSYVNAIYAIQPPNSLNPYP